MWPELLGASGWIGERLLVGSMQGAVAVGLAWAACRWIPRVPAAVQTWVWWLVTAKLVAALLPLPALPVPLLPAPEAGVVPAAASTLAASLPTVIDPAAEAFRASTNPIGVLDVFLGAWVIGVLVHGVLLARAAATTRRLVQHSTPLSGADLAAVSRMAAIVGLRQVPRVCASPDVDVPQVMGFRNPVVLLPADAHGRFSDSEWQMALGHELLHVRRQDVLLGCVPALAERLYFFHPLARLAAREYAMAREAACDAAVVRTLDVPADDYGRLLLRLGIARSRPVLAASSAAPSASCLRRRLEMLQHTSSTTVSRLMTAAVAATALLALAPVEMVAQNPPAPPALPALPAAPAPPAPPAASARALPPAAPQRPAPAAAPLPPAAPTAPSAPAAPVAPLPPLPPQPPPPPSSDEVVLRLKAPATEQEAIDTATRVLATQLAQIRSLVTADRDVQQRAAQQSMLAQQMAELNRQRDALVQQQRELERQIAQTSQALERMKAGLRSAEEDLKKR